MSKERLEEIKMLWEQPHGISVKDVDWLIEQAEQVEGLEYENKIIGESRSEKIVDNVMLKQQNKQLREAINKFFDLEGGYQDIVNRAEYMFMRVLDKTLEGEE